MSKTVFAKSVAQYKDGNGEQRKRYTTIGFCNFSKKAAFINIHRGLSVSGSLILTVPQESEVDLEKEFNSRQLKQVVVDYTQEDAQGKTIGGMETIGNALLAGPSGNKVIVVMLNEGIGVVGGMAKLMLTKAADKAE